MIGCYSKIPRATKGKTSGEGEAYAGGVRNLLLLRKEEIIVGTGDGTVELAEISTDSLHVRDRTKKLLVMPCIKTVNETILLGRANYVCNSFSP